MLSVSGNPSIAAGTATGPRGLPARIAIRERTVSGFSAAPISLGLELLMIRSWLDAIETSSPRVCSRAT